MGSSIKLQEVGRMGDFKCDVHKRPFQIVQIIVSHNTDCLKSLQFHYLDNGRVIASDIIGSQTFSGSHFDVITFKDPLEFITKVEGNSYYCRCFHYYRIGKLSIHTNKTSYDIFDAKIPTSYDVLGCPSSFSYNFGEANQFGGFYGTHDSWEVTSIGFYFNNLTAPPFSKAKLKSKR